MSKLRQLKRHVARAPKAAATTQRFSSTNSWSETMPGPRGSYMTFKVDGEVRVVCDAENQDKPFPKNFFL